MPLLSEGPPTLAKNDSLHWTMGMPSAQGSIQTATSLGLLSGACGRISATDSGLDAIGTLCSDMEDVALREARLLNGKCSTSMPTYTGAAPATSAGGGACWDVPLVICERIH